MNRLDAEKKITEYLNPIYGFALKRCKSLQDAEDLSQEIVIKAFHTLLIKDDITDVGKFIWTIAHNTLSNYYRDHKQHLMGASIDEIAEILCDSRSDIASDYIMQETISKLQSEIAYLSKLQRRIVIAYYYENKKQNEIAEELGIPVGTIKWHLFEAKKELKRGMENMRTSNELKFNPIRFAICGTNGSVGSKGDNGNFFRSPLTQNIAYAVWKEPKTINEIADALGVSPVYVESEAEYLEEYGFLTKQGEKYLCNILLDEATTEQNRLHDEMYERAAEIFANELYDELINADIWDNPNITGGITEDITSTDAYLKDKNFFLWSLIPYIAAHSGEPQMDSSISFEEAATIRPDGGQNICCASVINTDAVPPMYADCIQKWNGPCWNGNEDLTLWQIDSEWSGQRIGDTYQSDAQHALRLLKHHINNTELRADEYAYLVEKGYLKMLNTPDGKHNATWQCVYINGKDIKNTLISIGDKIREKHKEEFHALRKSYIDSVLAVTPKHLLTTQKYCLQFTFHADGWFILHCIKALLNNGKLKPPADSQQKALTTIIIHE